MVVLAIGNPMLLQIGVPLLFLCSEANWCINIVCIRLPTAVYNLTGPVPLAVLAFKYITPHECSLLATALSRSHVAMVISFLVF